MYKAVDLAKYIVTKCVNDKCPISNLQLQKILYYIQKKFLDDENNTIFLDDIEAWQFGPVVPKVYYMFCAFGSMPIRFEYENAPIDEHDRIVIDTVVEEKRILDPWALVDDTHEQGKAWSIIYNDGAGNKKIIPPDLIKKVG